MGFFGKTKIQNHELQECLAYSEAETRLRALHKEHALYYNNTADKYYDSITRDPLAASEMCKAGNQGVQVANEVVRRHEEMGPAPDAASAIRSVSHAMYLTWATWASANAAIIEAEANGLTPDRMHLKQLDDERVAARHKVEDEEKRLAKKTQAEAERSR